MTAFHVHGSVMVSKMTVPAIPTNKVALIAVGYTVTTMIHLFHGLRSVTSLPTAKMHQMKAPASMDAIVVDGNCVPKDARCNGFIDCWPTAEDELGCPCDGPDLFQCSPDGPCVLAEYKCDRHHHCPNGEDEQNCPCPNQFQCKSPPNIPCLPQELRCNCFNDCPDGSDEINCGFNPPPPPPPPRTSRPERTLNPELLKIVQPRNEALLAGRFNL